MRFIIVGAGDVGVSLSMKLAGHEHDVTLIERSPERISPEVATLDIKVVMGNGCSPHVLQEAGLETADYFIAVTESDETNVASCFVSRLINPRPKRIARVRDLSLAHRAIPTELLQEYFDLIINPEEAGADYLLQLFHIPGAREIHEFAFGKARALGLSLTSDSPILGKTVGEVNEQNESRPIAIVAYLRGSKITLPKNDDKLRLGDVVYFVLTPENTKEVFRLSGRTLHEGKTAIIWGGSALARSIALKLDKESPSVKLILSDPDEQIQMADELKNTLVLNGEGTDESLLLDENIDDTDAFIAATPDEENNVLAALLAKKLGARTVMALVNKATYLPLVSTVGVDVVVSSRLAAATTIFRHIHSRSVISEIALQTEAAGFVELDVSGNMPLAGVPLRDLKISYGIKIAFVVREDSVKVVREDEVLTEGDRIIIFALKTASSKLEKLLDLRLEAMS